MPAYLIGRIKIDDRVTEYATYVARVTDTIKPLGNRVLEATATRRNEESYSLTRRASV